MVLGVVEFSFCAVLFPLLAIAWISLETISDVILNLWNLKLAFKILWNKDVSYQPKKCSGNRQSYISLRKKKNDSCHSFQTVLTKASQNKLSAICRLWCLTLKKKIISQRYNSILFGCSCIFADNLILFQPVNDTILNSHQTKKEKYVWSGLNSYINQI